MRRRLLGHIALMLVSAGAYAQSGYNERARKYIEQYAPMAIEEQRMSGIPAAITLGQGILETEAGASELLVNANNHFGIKCKNNWQGETYTYTDDAPNECFKKYKDAAESFRDHSLHLKRNPRYAPLFSIPLTDYSNWAVTIRKCGYATNPQYAQRLIKIIEEFRLDQYTKTGLEEPQVLVQAEPVIPEATGRAEIIQAKYVYKDTVAAQPALATAAVAPAPVAAVPVQKSNSKIVVHMEGADSKSADPIRSIADSARNVIMQHETDNDYFAAVPPVDSTKIITVNGLKAFRGVKGETLLKYAVHYKIRYPQLLEYNDLPDAPLAFDTYVYLEKKKATGANDRHSVKDGETLVMIAQEEGIQLKRLMALNHLNSKDVPVVGAVLELQTPATQKPEVKVVAVMPAHRGNAITTADTAKHSNYITLRDKPVKPAEPAAPTTTQEAPKQESKIKTVLTKLKSADTVKAAPMATSTGADATITAMTEPVDTTDSGPYVVFLTGDKTDILTNTSMQWIRPENEKVEIKPARVMANDPAALTRLKAELDPIVYADNSNLIATQPPPRAAAKAAVYYTVKKGETATSIARKHGVTVNDLLKWNQISASDIKVGQELKVSE